jgi:hypothetical protein
VVRYEVEARGRKHTVPDPSGFLHWQASSPSALHGCLLICELASRREEKASQTKPTMSLYFTRQRSSPESSTWTCSMDQSPA